MKKKILTVILLTFIILFAAFPLPAAAGQQHNNANILCIWTDGHNLKAVTLLIFNPFYGRIGILSVPVFARLELADKPRTVANVWSSEGKKGLQEKLEQALHIKIDGHITFDQPVIEKASNLVGNINIQGQTTTLLQAFEETRLERRKDDQEVIRALAASIISPVGIKKVPGLLWLFTTQVDSNIHPELMLAIYQVVRRDGPTTLTKRALQGHDYYHNGHRYRYVKPQTWQNIINELSA
ncbi:hypothetical protein JCM39194_02270 [Desulfotomaculum varum]